MGVVFDPPAGPIVAVSEVLGTGLARGGASEVEDAAHTVAMMTAATAAGMVPRTPARIIRDPPTAAAWLLDLSSSLRLGRIPHRIRSAFVGRPIEIRARSGGDFTLAEGPRWGLPLGTVAGGMEPPRILAVR